jgi:hypothetical protein
MLRKDLQWDDPAHAYRQGSGFGFLLSYFPLFLLFVYALLYHRLGLQYLWSALREPI